VARVLSVAVGAVCVCVCVCACVRACMCACARVLEQRGGSVAEWLVRWTPAQKGQ